MLSENNPGFKLRLILSPLFSQTCLGNKIYSPIPEEPEGRNQESTPGTNFRLALPYTLSMGAIQSMYILLLESPCPLVGPSVTKFQQNFSAQYLGNEKSYRRSAGVKTTGFSRAFWIFQKNMCFQQEHNRLSTIYELLTQSPCTVTLFDIITNKPGIK